AEPVGTMDEKLRSLVSDLRNMGSGTAADWLIDRYPAGSTDWGAALSILPHLSWERADQVRLATHYLARLPLASAKPYEVFASFMQLPKLIDILREKAPKDAQDRGLFEYHAGPVLMQAAKTPRDREVAQAFLSELRAAGLGPYEHPKKV